VHTGQKGANHVKQLTDHSERYSLAAEVHARLSVELSAPSRASYVAVLVAPEDRADELHHLATLCERFSVTPPQAGATHFSALLDHLRIKWERHGEFSGYTFFVEGLAAQPFAEPAVSFLPDGWLEGVPGMRMVAAHASFSRTSMMADRIDSRDLEAYFVGNIAVGAAIGDGIAQAFTDFKIHKDGYCRFVIVDRGMSPEQAGRMVQRLFEIEAYRMLALLGLPVARQKGGEVSAMERRLTAVTDAIGAEATSTPSVGDEHLLGELTKLAAEVERALAASQYRFGASRAYYELVKTRIHELREQRLAGVQTIEEFMTRRLTPAMATCATVSQRLRDLSDRVAQTSGLLSTRVDIAREKQNQALLASMDRRAKLQLRLQQTVEGLSVAAITYYVVGLSGWLFKGVAAAGVPVNVELATGLSIPVVVLLVAFALRRARRKIVATEDEVARK
jgi:uncharacterized membrane-anchored protein